MAGENNTVMFSWHSACGYCTDHGGENYKNSIFKCNNQPSEETNSALFPPKNTMNFNVLKIPHNGVIN